MPTTATSAATSTTEGDAHGTEPTHGRDLRPLADRVVVVPSPHDERTKSGIVIPDTVKERPQEGSVLSVGPGRLLDDGTREPMDVTKGDKVLYAKYAGTEFKIHELELLIIGQKDILAIVED